MKLASWIFFFFCLSCTILVVNTSYGQPKTETNETDYYEIETNKGEIYYGTIISRDNNQIILSIEDGIQITIPESQIKRIEKIESSLIRNGRYWRPMPHYTNYYFANSAFMLEKGQGTYSNAYIFFNSITYGITDWLTIGGGIELISTFSPDVPALGFFRVKAGTQLADNLRLSGGLLTFTTSTFEGSASLLFSSLTLGKKEKQTTIGLGYNLIDETDQNIAINISHMRRWRKRTAFITENWIFTGDNGFNIYSYGIRFFGSKISADLAFINNEFIYEAIRIGVPYVGFKVGF